MRTDLFRAQVLQRSADSGVGGHTVHQPPGLRLLLLLFVSLFLALLAFAATARISRTEVVRGQLSLDAGVTSVHVPRAAIVAELSVTEGSLVEQGQTLMVLQVAAAHSMDQQAHSFVQEQIERQSQAVGQQRSLLRAREQAGTRQLDQQIETLRRELALQVQLEGLLQERLDLATQSLQRSAQLLARAAAAPATHAQALESHAIARQQVLAHALEVQQREQALATLLIERESLALEIRNERLSLDVALSQLAMQRVDRELQQSFTISAPVAGRIGALLVRQGSQVEPGRPVLSLLPAGATLVAQLFVPSRAAGALVQGQSVLLAFDAFPLSLHGSFPATVSRVSAATVDPREFLIPLEAGEPVYLVEAALQEARLATGEALPLRAGMQLTAQIITGRQTLLARVTAPLRTLEQRL